MSIRKYVLSGNISRVYVFLLVILAVSFVFNGLFQGGQSEAVHVLFVEEVKGTSGRIVVLRASSVVARGVAVLEDPNGMRIKAIPFMMVGQEASFSVSLAEFPSPYVQVKVSLWSFGYQGYGRMRVDTRAPVSFIVERGVLYVPEGQVYRLPTLENLGSSAKIGTDALVVVPNNLNLYKGVIYRPWLVQSPTVVGGDASSDSNSVSVPVAEVVPSAASEVSENMSGMVGGSVVDDSSLTDMDVTESLSMVDEVSTEGTESINTTGGTTIDGVIMEAGTNSGESKDKDESFRSRRGVKALKAADSDWVAARRMWYVADAEASAVRREMLSSFADELSAEAGGGGSGSRRRDDAVSETFKRVSSAFMENVTLDAKVFRRLLAVASRRVVDLGVLEVLFKEFLYSLQPRVGVAGNSKASGAEFDAADAVGVSSRGRGSVSGGGVGRSGSGGSSSLLPLVVEYESGVLKVTSSVSVVKTRMVAKTERRLETVTETRLVQRQVAYKETVYETTFRTRVVPMKVTVTEYVPRLVRKVSYKRVVVSVSSSDDGGGRDGGGRVHGFSVRGRMRRVGGGGRPAAVLRGAVVKRVVYVPVYTYKTVYERVQRTYVKYVSVRERVTVAREVLRYRTVTEQVTVTRQEWREYTVYVKEQYTVVVSQVVALIRADGRVYINVASSVGSRLSAAVRAPGELVTGAELRYREYYRHHPREYSLVTLRGGRVFSELGVDAAGVLDGVGNILNAVVTGVSEFVDAVLDVMGSVALQIAADLGRLLSKYLLEPVVDSPVFEAVVELLRTVSTFVEDVGAYMVLPFFRDVLMEVDALIYSAFVLLPLLHSYSVEVEVAEDSEASDTEVVTEYPFRDMGLFDIMFPGALGLGGQGSSSDGDSADDADDFGSSGGHDNGVSTFPGEHQDVVTAEVGDSAFGRDGVGFYELLRFLNWAVWDDDAENSDEALISGTDSGKKGEMTTEGTLSASESSVPFNPENAVDFQYRYGAAPSVWDTLLPVVSGKRKEGLQELDFAKVVALQTMLEARYRFRQLVGDVPLVSGVFDRTETILGSRALVLKMATYQLVYEPKRINDKGELEGGVVRWTYVTKPIGSQPVHGVPRFDLTRHIPLGVSVEGYLAYSLVDGVEYGDDSGGGSDGRRGVGLVAFPFSKLTVIPDDETPYKNLLSAVAVLSSDDKSRQNKVADDKDPLNKVASQLDKLLSELTKNELSGLDEEALSKLTVGDIRRVAQQLYSVEVQNTEEDLMAVIRSNVESYMRNNPEVLVSVMPAGDVESEAFISDVLRKGLLLEATVDIETLDVESESFLVQIREYMEASSAKQRSQKEDNAHSLNRGLMLLLGVPWQSLFTLQQLKDGQYEVVVRDEADVPEYHREVLRDWVQRLQKGADSQRIQKTYHELRQTVAAARQHVYEQYKVEWDAAAEPGKKTLSADGDHIPSVAYSLAKYFLDGAYDSKTKVLFELDPVTFSWQYLASISPLMAYSEKLFEQRNSIHSLMNLYRNPFSPSYLLGRSNAVVWEVIGTATSKAEAAMYLRHWFNRFALATFSSEFAHITFLLVGAGLVKVTYVNENAEGHEEKGKMVVSPDPQLVELKYEASTGEERSVSLTFSDLLTIVKNWRKTISAETRRNSKLKFFSDIESLKQSVFTQPEFFEKIFEGTSVLNDAELAELTEQTNGATETKTQKEKAKMLSLFWKNFFNQVIGGYFNEDTASWYPGNAVNLFAP